MTVLSDAEKMERLMRRNLDGNFRRMRPHEGGMTFENVKVSADYIPDYCHLIRVARGNHD